MSFRTRLTSFFVLIVVVPMIAVGFLVFRLIGDSEQGKADARANGLATSAASVYQAAISTGRADAREIASDPRLLSGSGLSSRIAVLASQAGLARLTLTQGDRVLADVGDRSALRPDVEMVRAGGGAPVTVTVSALTAAQYARELTATDARVVVRQAGRTLSATVPIPSVRPMPRQGEVTAAGSSYRAVTQSFTGFGGQPVQVTVLSNTSATSSSLGSSGPWPLCSSSASCCSHLPSLSLHRERSRGSSAASSRLQGDLQAAISRPRFRRGQR